MDTCSWIGGWTPQGTTIQGWAGRLFETTARAKVIMDYGDKHQQNTETSSAFVYTQWQKQNLTDTQTTYSEIHDLCLICVA